MSEMNVLPAGYVLRGPELTYKIISVLGRGGFGITYLAEATVRVGNVSMRGRFAIKEHFMSGECEREGESMRVVCSNPVRERVQNSLKDFISEAHRLHKVGVDHPNIVRVNEVFEANGTAYYVMECLEGEPLSAYVKRRGPLAEDEMLAIMRPVVDAVRYLHSARMTHLDIKPENIMLTHDENDALRPVLIDFGLAKHYDKDGRPTSTINILGCSDGYAPMEQYAGITTFSPAADCYALGATMWFCLTGKTPPKSTALRDGQLAATIAGRASDETRAMIDAACRVNQYDRTFPGATGGADAESRKQLPRLKEKPLATSSTSTKLVDKPRRRFPVRIVAACVVAIALIVAAILGIRSCDSAPTVAEQMPQMDNPMPHFSTSPIDMALCAEGPDGYVYIAADQWKTLSESQQSKFKPRGVYLAKGNFIVELHDKESGKEMVWNAAMRYNLPTKEQGLILVDNKTALNNALSAFGGTIMDWYYWTKTEYDSSYAWYVNVNYGYGCNNKSNTVRVRAVVPVP